MVHLNNYIICMVGGEIVYYVDVISVLVQIVIWTTKTISFLAEMRATPADR